MPIRSLRYLMCHRASAGGAAIIRFCETQGVPAWAVNFPKIKNKRNTASFSISISIEFSRIARKLGRILDQHLISKTVSGIFSFIFSLQNICVFRNGFRQDNIPLLCYEIAKI